LQTVGREYIGVQRTIDEAAAFGCKRAVCPWRPPETFGSADGIKELAAQLNAANDTLKQHGITLLYHNHDFEMGKVDGTTGLQSLVNQLDPAIGIELDTYWVQVGGIDPVALIRDLGSRVHLIHVKDGHIDPKSPMLAVGEGKMDYAAIVAALPSSVEWLVVELDQCGTDMIEAVQKSATYLVGKGLGHGR
jgi:sugar phosphate isomerase/epimerase